MTRYLGRSPDAPHDLAQAMTLLRLAWKTRLEDVRLGTKQGLRFLTALRATRGGSPAGTWPEYRAVLDVLIRAGVPNGTTGALDMLDALALRAARGGTPAREPSAKAIAAAIELAPDSVPDASTMEEILRAAYAVDGLRAGPAPSDRIDLTPLPECTCLPGPTVRGPVGTERITNPECPIHGPAVPSTEAALRQAIEQLMPHAETALHYLQGKVGIAAYEQSLVAVRAALAGAPPSERGTDE